MKAINLLFVTILLSVICSCDGKPYPHLMQMADSLVDMYPDSALVLLEQLKDNIREEPKATRMYYHLLTIKAKDKSYPIFTSESLIKPLLDYYEKKKDKKHLPEVYYYAGLAYRNIGDAPQALDYSQKALNASKGDINYRLIYKIYHQIGMIYHYNQSEHSKSIEPFKNAYQYAVLSGDSTLMTYGLLFIARGFQGEDLDSLSLYYSKASEMAQKIHNMDLYSIVNVEWGSCYLQEKEYQKAYDALLASQKSIIHPATYYFTCANIFYETNRLDSAQHYYEKILSINNHHYNRSAYYNDQRKSYKMLSNIARKQENPIKALEYIDKYMIYGDSLQKAREAEDIKKMNARFNYQFREKENHRLESLTQKQETRIMLLSAGIICILTLILSTCIIYLLRRKQRAILVERQKEKLKDIAEEQYRSSQEFIIANEKRIELIKEKQRDTENKKNEMEKTLQEAEKELLELTNKQIETKQKIHVLSEKAFKESQIYKDFYHVAKMPHSETISEKGRITTEDWEELKIAINKTYNDFTKRLRDLYPQISEHEIHICILLKMSIPPTNIADITARSKQAINSSRKKLYEKTHNQIGTPSLWDSFIQSF